MRTSVSAGVAVVVAVAFGVGAGVLIAVGVVRPPAAVCITPFGTATAGSGCDLGQVSATLAAVGGALTSVFALALALAAESAIAAWWRRRH